MVKDMSSRFEKYEYDNNSSLDNMSRTSRNKDIYNSTDMSELSRIKTNNNVSIISDGTKEIDLEKIKKYIYSVNNDETEEKRRRLSLELPKEEEKVIERKEEKDYDINSVLERARERKESNYELERHRKLNNTGYDILKSIKTRKIDDEEDLTPSIDELNTEEKTIVDLIQNIQKDRKNNKDLEMFSELMSDNEETAVMAAIDDEISNTESFKAALEDITQNLESIKEPLTELTEQLYLEKEKLKQRGEEYQTEELGEEDSETVQEERNTEEFNTETTPRISSIDKSFYTNSLSFNKTDFEGFEELEKNVKRSNTFTKIAIILIILLLVATVVVIVNFAFGK